MSIRKSVRAMRAILCLGLTCFLLFAGCGRQEDPEPEAVVAVVGGRELTRSQFDFYLNIVLEDMLEHYREIDWSGEIEGVPMRDYVKAQALEHAKQSLVIEQKAAEYGCGLTQEELGEIERSISYETDLAGGAEAYAQMLLAQGSTPGMHRYYNFEIQYMYFKLYDYLYEEPGLQSPEEGEIERFFWDEYMRMTTVLVSTIDREGSQLDDTAREAKEQMAREIREMLAETGAYENIWDYDDGSGMVGTNEQYMTRDESAWYDPSLESLEVGQYSDVIDTPYGFYIFERMELDGEYLRENPEIVRTMYLDHLFARQVEDWSGSITAETEPLYDQIDPSSYALG